MMCCMSWMGLAKRSVALAARVDVRHPTCDSTIRRARTMKYKIDTMW